MKSILKLNNGIIRHTCEVGMEDGREWVLTNLDKDPISWELALEDPAYTPEDIRFCLWCGIELATLKIN